MLSRRNGVVCRNVMVVIRRLVLRVPSVVHAMRNGNGRRGNAGQHGQSRIKKTETERVAHGPKYYTASAVAAKRVPWDR
jgi:hypothetical protein